jgi:hypothetical protein
MKRNEQNTINWKEVFEHWNQKVENFLEKLLNIVLKNRIKNFNNGTVDKQVKYIN